MQGFPIKAAEFSKCHFPKVWGTSHCFPLRFTVGGNTTQEPGQGFEIKLEDALSSVQKHRERRFDSDHVSHSWSPALPLLLMEGNYSSHGTGPAAQAGGWGSKTHSLSVNPLSRVQSSSIQLDSSCCWSDFLILFWDPHHHFQAAARVQCCTRSYPCICALARRDWDERQVHWSTAISNGHENAHSLLFDLCG